MILRNIKCASLCIISVFMYQNIFAKLLVDPRSDSKTKPLTGKNETLNITVATDATVEIEKTEKQNGTSKEERIKINGQSVKSNESSGEIPLIMKASTAVNNETVTQLNETMRVVGGEPYSIEYFPHQAYLSIRHTSGYITEMWCGATIISDSWLLTAAHCAIHDDTGELVHPRDITVHVGTDDSDAYSRPWYVAHSIVHGGYKAEKYGQTNDICLLKLHARLTFNRRVQPAQLPKEGEEKKWVNVENKVWVSGFGSTKFHGYTVRFLRAASVTIFSQSVCMNKLRLENTEANEMWLCAGIWSGGKDTCQGDSGGPLGVFEGNRFTILGITSSGGYCGRPATPGYYTRVSHYVKWIDKMMRKPDYQ